MDPASLEWRLSPVNPQSNYHPINRTKALTSSHDAQHCEMVQKPIWTEEDLYVQHKMEQCVFVTFIIASILGILLLLYKRK